MLGLVSVACADVFRPNQIPIRVSPHLLLDATRRQQHRDPMREDPARDARFRSLLDNPPFPAGSSLEDQRDIMDVLTSIDRPAV